jgi:hypothetical protein
MIADTSPTNSEPSSLSWVLPSYAEPSKNDIKCIIDNEKAKLCSSKVMRKQQLKKRVCDGKGSNRK